MGASGDGQVPEVGLRGVGKTEGTLRSLCKRRPKFIFK